MIHRWHVLRRQKLKTGTTRLDNILPLMTMTRLAVLLDRLADLKSLKQVGLFATTIYCLESASSQILLGIVEAEHRSWICWLPMPLMIMCPIDNPFWMRWPTWWRWNKLGFLLLHFPFKARQIIHEVPRLKHLELHKAESFGMQYHEWLIHSVVLHNRLCKTVVSSVLSFSKGLAVRNVGLSREMVLYNWNFVEILLIKINLAQSRPVDTHKHQYENILFETADSFMRDLPRYKAEDWLAQGSKHA